MCLPFHSGAQFLEQPGPGTVFAPVQDQVTLTCSVDEGFATNWRVAFSNGDGGDASNGIVLGGLLERNFTLEGVGSTRSTLSLRETQTQTNNGTNITCLAHETGAETRPTLGHTVAIIFYGK